MLLKDPSKVHKYGLSYGYQEPAGNRAETPRQGAFRTADREVDRSRSRNRRRSAWTSASRPTERSACKPGEDKGTRNQWLFLGVLDTHEPDRLCRDLLGWRGRRRHLAQRQQRRWRVGNRDLGDCLGAAWMGDWAARLRAPRPPGDPLRLSGPLPVQRALADLVVSNVLRLRLRLLDLRQRTHKEGLEARRHQQAPSWPG